MISLVLSLLFCLQPATSESDSSGQESRAVAYLMQYGYVEPRQLRSSLLTEEEYRQTVSRVVRDFQAFANLNMTGQLDGETLEMMERPRCGVRDRIGEGARARRRKRFVLQGSRWQRTNLTYRLSRYPADSALSKSEIEATLSQAFTLWSEASGLQFRPSLAGKADIDISFFSFQHGDGDPFDGPGW